MEDLRSVINKPTYNLYADTIATNIGCAILNHYKELRRFEAFGMVEDWVATWNPNCNGYNGLDEWMDSTMEDQSFDWSGGQQTMIDKSSSSGGHWSGNNNKTPSSGNEKKEMADKVQLPVCPVECNHGVVDIWKQNKAYNVMTTDVDWYGGQQFGFDCVHLTSLFKQMTLFVYEAALPPHLALEKTSSGGEWNGNDITEMVNILKKSNWWIFGQQVADNTKETLALQQEGNAEETLAVQQVADSTTKDTLTVELSGSESIENPLDWSDVQPSEANRFKKVSSKLKKTAQELKDAGINFNQEDLENLHTMSREEFDHLLMNNNLSQEQIEKCKEIRRRGKNSVAANKSRKRKCTQIDELAEELELKESEKRASQVKNQQLHNMKLKEAKRLNMLKTKIVTLSNLSPDHYTVKVINNEAKVVRKNVVY